MRVAPALLLFAAALSARAFVSDGRASEAPAGNAPPVRIVVPEKSGARVPAISPIQAAPDPAMNEVEARLAQARGLLRLGKIEEALQQLRDLHRKHPDDVRIIAVLGSSLLSSDRRADAIALYRDAADRLRDPGPALAELERLYREDQDWSRALQVCFEYLDRVGDEHGWVTDEIESLIRSDRAGSKVLESLEEAARRDPKNQKLAELRITALLYHGKPEEAVQRAAELDRERKAGGAILLRYASTAEEKRYEEVALDGYDRILKLNPSDRIRTEALYRKATVLRRLGRRDEGLAAYDAAAAGSGSFSFRARLEKAAVLEREMHRPEEALAAYQQVLDLLETAPGRDRAELGDNVRLSMAECQLRLARPAEAMRLYQELAEKGSDPQTRAASLYQVGEMLFYQGKLKEAEEVWFELTDKYPTLKWVNDALARILLVGENGDAGGVPVTALAQAEYQRRLGNVTAGLKLVDEALEQHPKARAADDLLLERVSLLLSLGRLPESKEASDTLATRFPESILAPRAFMAVANEQARQPGGGTEAQALYLELLLRFPDSLEAADARAILQKLKDRSRDSSMRGGEPVRPEETPAERRRG